MHANHGGTKISNCFEVGMHDVALGIKQKGLFYQCPASLSIAHYEHISHSMGRDKPSQWTVHASY